jgi:hypothetical protein
MECNQVGARQFQIALAKIEVAAPKPFDFDELTMG